MNQNNKYSMNYIPKTKIKIVKSIKELEFEGNIILYSGSLQGFKF